MCVCVCVYTPKAWFYLVSCKIWDWYNFITDPCVYRPITLSRRWRVCVCIIVCLYIILFIIIIQQYAKHAHRPSFDVSIRTNSFGKRFQEAARDAYLTTVNDNVRDVCLVCTQDDLWGNCAKKIKLDPTASQNDGAGSGSAAAVVPPADANNGSASAESGIRRSARNRRPRGELIVVSSNDTLLDLKMKVSFQLL